MADIHLVERDAPLERYGINRFSSNGPVGIYPCKEGSVGIGWHYCDNAGSLEIAVRRLKMERERAEEKLATRELRFKRLDEVEQAMIRALSAGTALLWAELGRRVRIVVLSDAAGILSHPILAARESQPFPRAAAS
ncbi:hypothetical protein [Bradyrhizobium sp. CB2312]|uniref:hypothetical protein n=1 Tax=Bradyrhizobium sp. CB2312 TaxID=3039155 RepID=UPI0024B1F612|nr:hypothetical protein [Bradyrhizobium sp. CB2312]WFU71234.1 hypothetical protein QA642_39390 [Bradyrhizobium sp. CB2312]